MENVCTRELPRLTTLRGSSALPHPLYHRPARTISRKSLPLHYTSVRARAGLDVRARFSSPVQTTTRWQVPRKHRTSCARIMVKRWKRKTMKRDMKNERFPKARIFGHLGRLTNHHSAINTTNALSLISLARVPSLTTPRGLYLANLSNAHRHIRLLHVRNQSCCPSLTLSREAASAEALLVGTTCLPISDSSDYNKHRRRISQKQKERK